jgi:hypothetical protein
VRALSLWKTGIALAGILAVALVAVGVTYLSVDAGSLPSALGRVAGSTTRDSTRGFFATMVGGFFLLIAIVAAQFRPGGPLTVTERDEMTAAASRPAPVAPAAPAAPAATAAPAAQAATATTAATEYIGEVDDEEIADPIISLAARRREERRAVEEAGGGESEGFELAEQELIDHASHGDEHRPSRIMRDAVGPDEEAVDSVSGEADSEHLPD